MKFLSSNCSFLFFSFSYLHFEQDYLLNKALSSVMDTPRRRKTPLPSWVLSLWSFLSFTTLSTWSEIFHSYSQYSKKTSFSDLLWRNLDKTTSGYANPVWFSSAHEEDTAPSINPKSSQRTHYHIDDIFFESVHVERRTIYHRNDSVVKQAHQYKPCSQNGLLLSILTNQNQAFYNAGVNNTLIVTLIVTRRKQPGGVIKKKMTTLLSLHTRLYLNVAGGRGERNIQHREKVWLCVFIYNKKKNMMRQVMRVELH